MPPKTTPPRPRPGQQRQRRPVQRERLESLGSPAPTRIRATTPVLITTTKTSTRPVLQCSNPQCPSPNVVETEDGAWVCDTCGAVAQEEPHLVGEVEFTELQGGRIAQAGTHIGATQTHQRTYALGGHTGVAGREATATREKTEADARRIMQRYIYLPDFRIREAEVDSGMNIFKLAYSNGFVQGRTIESVAIVSLYLACRRKYTQEQGVRRPVYALMLIDFAETLNINVFALGRMYSDLVRKLFLRSDGRLEDRDSADLLAMGPEVLVERFVSDLSFGPDERKVRDDAIRIVRRMNRDWMTTGRRPSGVCGAAILLAARMNNYRRTTREVVLTAKVTEITINKRLEEFADTGSSLLSVTDFRNAEVLDAVTPADPPAYQRARNPNSKKKRGRPRKKGAEPETAAEIEGGNDVEEDTTNQPARSSKRPRIDAEGYKIPEIPAHRRLVIDPSQQETANSAENTYNQNASQDRPATRARGRPPGAKSWRAPPASAAELAIEADIERDVLEALRQNPELDPSGQAGQISDSPNQDQLEDTDGQEAQNSEYTDSDNDADDNDDEAENSDDAEAAAIQTATNADSARVIRSHKDPPGPAVNTNIGNLGLVSLSPTLKPDEFDDDPDIATCLLNEEETQLKERVWVTANADWLRQDHAKRIKRELKEAEMREKGIDPTKQSAKGMQKRRKDGARRAGRLGDVSYLNDPEPGRGNVAAGDVDEGAAEGEYGADARDGPGTPSRTTMTGAGTVDRERTASESVRKMLKTRGVYSRRVNYDVLDSIYGADSSDSRSRSRSASVSVSFSGSVNDHNNREQRDNRGADLESEDGDEGRERDERAESVASSAISQQSPSILVTTAPRSQRDERRRMRAIIRNHGDEGRRLLRHRPARSRKNRETPEESGSTGVSGVDSGDPASQNQNVLPTPPMTFPPPGTTTERNTGRGGRSGGMSASTDIESDDDEEDDDHDDGNRGGEAREQEDRGDEESNEGDDSDEDEDEADEGDVDEDDDDDDDDDDENEEVEGGDEDDDDLDAVFEGRY